MNERKSDKEKKKGRKGLWLNLLAMLATTVVLLVGVRWWLSAYTHHGEGIEVPDLYGMDVSTARTMTEACGLELVANDSSYNKKLPAGAVMAQLPASHHKVKKGRVVYVTINALTTPRVEIPDLIDNCSYREAHARLVALGFRVQPPRYIDGEKDWVYGIQCQGRNVLTGDRVAVESQLTLVVGNGSTDDDYDIEDYGDLDTLEMVGDGPDDDIDSFLEVTEESDN